MLKAKLICVRILAIAILATSFAFPAIAAASGRSGQQKVKAVVVEPTAPSTVIIPGPTVPASASPMNPSSMLVPFLVGGALFAQVPLLSYFSKKSRSRQET